MYQITNFPPEVIEELRYYVYRLVDPRNGETFYIGKGKGNRVFAHIRAELKSLDRSSLKLAQIESIRSLGLEVQHVIHRFGLDEKTAFEVEGALIDAYPGLTNEVEGHGSGDRGVRHSAEIIREFSAAQIDFQHKVMIISVNRSAADGVKSIYEAVRLAWVANLERARRAEYVLAVNHGLVIGVFRPTEWKEVTEENFPGHSERPGRIGFFGSEADEEIRKIYIGKRMPDSLRKKGAANPIRYSW